MYKQVKTHCAGLSADTHGKLGAVPKLGGPAEKLGGWHTPGDTKWLVIFVWNMRACVDKVFLLLCENKPLRKGSVVLNWGGIVLSTNGSRPTDVHTPKNEFGPYLTPYIKLTKSESWN